MPMYIIPPALPGSETERMCTAAGVQFSPIEKLYDLIKAYPDDGRIVVCTLDIDALIILTRNMSTLLPGTIEGIVGAPDITYPGKWVSIATTFGLTDWLEFERKIVKTGLLAATTSEVETRVPLQAKELTPEHAAKPLQPAPTPTQRHVRVPQSQIAPEPEVDDILGD